MEETITSVPQTYVAVGGRGEAMLWHTPAHVTVGNFKGEFTGLRLREDSACTTQ